MRTTSLKRACAFTIVEMVIAAAVGAIAMATLFSAVISIQRCFIGAEGFGMAKADQSRLSDYLALDLRRALTITPVTDGSAILSLEIPAYYDSDGKPRTPTITKFEAHYGGPTDVVTVVYKKDGASIRRQEGGGTPQTIATNVDDFQLSVQDLGKVVKTQVTFAPSMRGIANEAARTATTVYNTTLLRNRRKKP